MTDPRGPGSGSTRVNRGGSWINGAGSCRASGRFYNSPGFRHGVLGFRLLRTGIALVSLTLLPPAKQRKEGGGKP